MERKSNKQQKFHIRKGDTVKVIAGDSRGKTGKILTIIGEKNKAIVEGINLVSKHVKPSASKPNGGIEKKEAAVHISNLMLVDGSGKGIKVSRTLDAKAKLQRVSRKTKEVIKNG